MTLLDVTWNKTHRQEDPTTYRVFLVSTLSRSCLVQRRREYVDRRSSYHLHAYKPLKTMKNNIPALCQKSLNPTSRTRCNHKHFQLNRQSRKLFRNQISTNSASGLQATKSSLNHSVHLPAKATPQKYCRLKSA